jgi:MFS family permease
MTATVAAVPPALIPGRRRTLALASIAVLLAAADTYVVVLALPDMMSGVGLGVDQLQRATPIISAFLLGYVGTLPLIGRLADLRGCRPVLIGCLLVFALGCLVTATAHDLGPLVAGRALQGVGGGGLVPATLALVAQMWPEPRRGLPLGVVTAVQETGAVLGPLLGAAVLAVSGWRAIFWANLAGAVLLGGALRLVPSGSVPAGSTTAPGSAPKPGRSRIAQGLGGFAVAVLALFLIAPSSLVNGITTGRAWLPLLGEHDWTAPLPLLALVSAVAALAFWAPRARLGELLGRLDAIGSALLAGALAGLVLTFATADPQTGVITGRAPLLLTGSALLLAGFVVRQRTAAITLIPAGTLRRPAAWGALAVNLLVGAALVAALVDVPVFARNTAQHDQLGAALVLVQLLIAVPVGALAGGWAIRHWAPGPVSAAGMLLAALGLAGMTRWGDSTLAGLGGTLELVAAGLGFGLAIAPVTAALLAATEEAVHGVASALVVVARMVGMLAGLSVLTAVGLRVFYTRQQQIGTVLQVCPKTPTHCPAYTQATHAALLSELHAIFAGAAVCCALAAVLCLVLLPRRPTPPPSIP